MAANTFITDEHTAVIQKLVQEKQADPATYRGVEMMPTVQVPARKIRVEVLEASGGLTNEHQPGTQPKQIQRPGSKALEFEPAAYKEFVRFDERDILYLRELGKNDTSGRGVRQYIDRGVKRLINRMEARQEQLRWMTILNGGYTFMGNTLSFGIPGANRVTPTNKWSSDGTSSFTSSSTSGTANNAATPVQDLRLWTLGGVDAFRKFQIAKIWMNPNTARWCLDNSGVQSLIQYHFGSDNYTQHNVPDMFKFLIPGMPPVEIYDGYYLPESTDATGKIVAGNAIFHLPNGYIFFEVKPYDGGEKVGEFVESLNLSEGTIDNPGVGKFVVVDDNTAPGTTGGPKNPYFDIVGGFYGSPKLDLPQNVLTAYVL